MARILKAILGKPGLLGDDSAEDASIGPSHACICQSWKVIAGNSGLAKMIVRIKKRIQQALEISLLNIEILVI